MTKVSSESPLVGQNIHNMTDSESNSLDFGLLLVDAHMSHVLISRLQGVA